MTPLRPRAVRSRKNPNQPAPSSAEVTCRAEDLPVAVGVDLGRQQGMHVDRAACFTDFQHQRVGGNEGVREVATTLTSPIQPAAAAARP
jgi:hypothetical protein